MSVAQIGLREYGQDVAILFAAREIDVADQARHQSRSIDTGPCVAFGKRKASNRQRQAAVSGFSDNFFHVTPERSAREQAGFRIENAVGIERLEHASEAPL